MARHLPHSRRGRARRLDSINQQIEHALRSMKRGAALHFQPGVAGGRWKLSNGVRLSDQVAAAIVRDRNIVAVDLALFAGELAQTYRYAWTE
jgi:hypothetical protein